MLTKIDIEIRILTHEDVASMRALLRLFGKVFNEVKTYCESQPSSGYLRRLLSNENFITVVAVKENQVVGGLTAYVFEKYEQERREIYIYDLAVSAEHRRKGIATALIHELKRIGVHRKAYLIMVQADKGVEDEPAIALYTKLGKREDILHFDIALKGDT